MVLRGLAEGPVGNDPTPAFGLPPWRWRPGRSARRRPWTTPGALTGSACTARRTRCCREGYMRRVQIKPQRPPQDPPGGK
eukprot:15244657-Heterocapsa_arctica.AAC.1